MHVRAIASARTTRNELMSTTAPTPALAQRLHAVLRLTVALAASAALAATTACGAAPSDATSEDELQGGSVPAEGEHGATLYYALGDASCTGARVGPRHILTAAHCVWDIRGAVDLGADPVDERARPGATVSHLHGVDRRGGALRESRIASTLLHPSVKVAVESLRAARPEDAVGGIGATRPKNWPSYLVDVALIVLDEAGEDALAGVPVAPIARAPEPGSVVHVGGYGRVSMDASGPSDTLRMAALRLLDEPGVLASLPDAPAPPDVLLHYETRMHYRTRLEQYVVTPGLAYVDHRGAEGAPPPSASLMKGDSGGPVYAARSGRSFVVAVNSFNAAYVPSGATPRGVELNWHARLDHPRTIAWLASAGITTE